jgi:hypothetical protein
MELLEEKGCLKEMTRWKVQREVKSRNIIKNKGSQLLFWAWNLGQDHIMDNVVVGGKVIGENN